MPLLNRCIPSVECWQRAHRPSLRKASRPCMGDFPPTNRAAIRSMGILLRSIKLTVASPLSLLLLTGLAGCERDDATTVSQQVVDIAALKKALPFAEGVRLEYSKGAGSGGGLLGVAAMGAGDNAGAISGMNPLQDPLPPLNAISRACRDSELHAFVLQTLPTAKREILLAGFERQYGGYLRGALIVRSIGGVEVQYARITYPLTRGFALKTMSPADRRSFVGEQPLRLLDIERVVYSGQADASLGNLKLGQLVMYGGQVEFCEEWVRAATQLAQKGAAEARKAGF